MFAIVGEAAELDRTPANCKAAYMFYKSGAPITKAGSTDALSEPT